MFDALMIVGPLTIAVLLVITIWASRSRSRAPEPEQPSRASTSGVGTMEDDPPDQCSEDWATAPSDTPAAATVRPTTATEMLNRWSPAFVQASQTGSRVNAEIRAADCSEPGGDCGFAIVGESNYQP